MCEKRKIRNAACDLTSCASIWWKNLCASKKVPRTWKEMKILMRERFITQSYASICKEEVHLSEEETLIAPPPVTNILQEKANKQE